MILYFSAFVVHCLSFCKYYHYCTQAVLHINWMVLVGSLDDIQLGLASGTQLLQLIGG